MIRFFRSRAGRLFVVLALAFGLLALTPDFTFAQEQTQQPSGWWNPISWVQSAINWGMEKFEQAKNYVSGSSSTKAVVDPEVTGAFQRNCMFCEFVGRYIQIADSFAKDTFELLAPELRKILSYIFMIWIIAQSARWILGMGSPGEVFWSIVKQTAIFFVLMSFLVAGGRTSAYWQYIYEMPIRVAMQTSQEIMRVASPEQRVGPDCGKFNMIGVGTNRPMSSSTMFALTCLIERTEVANRFGVQVGWKMISEHTFSMNPLKMVAGISSYIIGLGVVTIFAISLVYFAFFVLDMFTRVAMLSAFAPMLIAAYFLNTTRDMARTALRGIIESSVTLMAASAVYGFVANIMAHVYEVMRTSPAVEQIMQDPKVAAAVESQRYGIEKALVLISYDAPFTPMESYFWYLVLSGLLTMMLTKKISLLVANLIKGAGGGTTMADTAAGAMVAGAMLMGRTAGGLVTGGMSAGASAGLRGVGGAVRGMKGADINPEGGFSHRMGHKAGSMMRSGFGKAAGQLGLTSLAQRVSGGLQGR